MRGLLVIATLVLAAGTFAQELTVAEVIAAHRAGAPTEGILRLIREAPAVTTLTPSDVERLRAAGVPEVIVHAMLARTAVPTPTAAPAHPDDPRLADVVRMVGTGLAPALVVEQIRRSGHRYALTANDLVYLKEHRVPDVVIAELLVAGPGPAATPVPTLTPRPVEAATFGPLLRMTGVFRRESTGSLILASDLLEWRDARGAEESSSLSTRSLRGFWLSSQPLGVTGTLVELRVLTRKDGDLTFRDIDWASGGNAQVLELYRALDSRFPQLVMREKAKR
jgi:hypothetical protein